MVSSACHLNPLRLRKPLVTFAEISRPIPEDNTTGTPKVTKIRQKALHSPFEPESFVANLIICCPLYPGSFSAATK